MLVTRHSLERQAASFCSAFHRKADLDTSLTLSASYRFLMVSLGLTDATMESIAGRFCSASDRHVASEVAYQQYVEAISPEAYRAYEQCLLMSQQELRFGVDVNSILPNQFSISVSFASKTDKPAARVLVAASDDVICRWKLEQENVGELKSGSTSILSCVRHDPNRRSYVKLVRGDRAGEESLTIPWLPYDKDGFAVDSLAVLMDRLATLEARASEQDRRLSQLAFETDTIMLRAVGTRALIDSSQCPTGPDNFRGEVAGRVDFSKPFATAPGVTVGLSEISLRGGEGDGMNRLRISITSVDERGFNYSFVTWCRTVVQSATASWLAIAK